MKRVTGIGGLFFKVKDPKMIREWYTQHLGFAPDANGQVIFQWRDLDNKNQIGNTVWGPFKENTTYFEPSTQPFMFNYRVDNLDALLEQLRKEGVTVMDQTEEYEFGKFGWIMDPEGNKIELWEPVSQKD